MSFGIWEILILLVIVVLLFGTKKLRTLGTDLGEGLKGFKNAVNDDSKDEKADADFEGVESKQAENEVKPATSEQKVKE